MIALLAIMATNTMIYTSQASEPLLARVRELSPLATTPRTRAICRVLLGASSIGPMRDPASLETLCADPDPVVACTARQWASRAFESAGDPDAALRWAQAALDLVDDDTGPWQRALTTSQLAGISLQIGRPAAADSYARAALPTMVELGASEDVAQLGVVLVLTAIHSGDLEAAEAMLDAMAAAASSGSVLGAALAENCCRPELHLARGEVDRGLAGYRRGAATLRTLELDLQGVDLGETATAPWVLFGTAAALAAHVRFGRPEPAAELAADLVGRMHGAVRGPFLDFPVTGACLFALGAWELVAPDGDPDVGCSLIALGEAFRLNRMLPTLDPAWVDEPAERLAPGRLAHHRAAARRLDREALRAAAARHMALE